MRMLREYEPALILLEAEARRKALHSTGLAEFQAFKCKPSLCCRDPPLTPYTDQFSSLWLFPRSTLKVLLETMGPNKSSGDENGSEVFKPPGYEFCAWSSDS